MLRADPGGDRQGRTRVWSSNRRWVMGGNDAALIEELRAGREDALEELIRRHEGRLMAFLRRRIADVQTCEDLLEEVFIGFLNALPNFDAGRTSVETFLFRIARNKLVDELRRRQRAAEAVAASTELAARQGGARTVTASSVARRAESWHRRAELIARILGGLIAEWKRSGQWERLKCAELLFACGWPNKKVATVLGISEQAVANHKSFILSKLRQADRR
ncbi:MAG: sigma-70 family RNA polymerase sigma factor [Planctomycetota bacterium]|nr:MAG: sigma-70 family RNA polymerase sigma factor [Planctomycetota bacterium]